MNYIIWTLISGFLFFINPIVADDALVEGGLDSIINITVVTDNQLKQQVPDIRTSDTPAAGLLSHEFTVIIIITMVFH